MPDQLTLTPGIGVILVFVAVVAGHRYRQTWISEGSRGRLWAYGALAAVSLLALALIPLAENYSGQ